MLLTQKTRTHGVPRKWFRSMPCFFFFICVASRVAALEADQLLLITNANVPQGRKLAEYYAQKRGVPDHRILELNLPTSEEMPADTYDREVVPVVRAYLRSNGLDRKVTCLVPFYGVPIRIGNRVNSAGDVQELAQIEQDIKALPDQTEPLVQAIEKAAAEVTPEFKPAAGAELDAQFKRASAALMALGQAIGKAPTPADRRVLEKRAVELIQPLIGPVGVIQRSLIASKISATAHATSGPATQPLDVFLQFRQESAALEERPFDPAARRKLREMVRNGLGPFEYARVLHAQADLFQTEATSAAFDSELSLLWWRYPRTRWVPNPLNYANASPRAAVTALMVMRLDAPQAGIVIQMIDTSFTAEQQGLKGRVVIDSRGLPEKDKTGKVDAYGHYDQGLRDLADLLQRKSRTKLQITFDDRPEVLEPHSVKGVALYMGWYSVDKYVPACEFVPGAVGFHLASFTMVSLRREDPRCWVRNLLDDGIASTLGAVDEPYLQSFPPAEDFFPLVLTGKLTMAEVYWKTVPWTSWRISMVGDPLYTPYKLNPVLLVDDLPERLQAVFKPAPAATQPH